MPEKILVVDDEEIIRDSLIYILEKEGYDVKSAENGMAADRMIKDEFFDLVITDLEMPKMKGTELLKNINKNSPGTVTMVITAYGSLDTAILAIREGAYDYILKPIEFDDLQLRVKRFFESRRLKTENRILKRDIKRSFDFDNLIGRSSAMQQVFDMVRTVADTDSTVLVTGKSGTGKELIARAIHSNSGRKNKPFVAVNCGAVAGNIIESELFGHKKGAFTGAVADKDGFLKAADGGTLFLDEISEMPSDLQVKLLRVIQEKEFTPVGTTYTIPVNVRFLASTNRNLEEEITAGNFREDLYYRLNVVEIELPSLREREDDIILLANHFVEKYREEIGKNVTGIDHAAISALMSYEWKGEVRELENVIERAVIFCKSDTITPDDLPASFQPGEEIRLPESGGSLDKFINSLERDYIVKTLKKYEFNKEKAAKELDLGLSTLYRKIKELGIDA